MADHRAELARRGHHRHLPRHRRSRARRLRRPARLVGLVGAGLAGTGLLAAVTTAGTTTGLLGERTTSSVTADPGRPARHLSREERPSRAGDRVPLVDLPGGTGARSRAADRAQRRDAQRARERVEEEARRAAEAARRVWHLPTRGYHLTARFGMVSGLWSTEHTGLDFAAPVGTPVFAVAEGVITQAGWEGAYGYRTVETLPDGTELWYAHQSAIRVTVGQRVAGGQTIGAVGATGNVTGPHVHLEVRPHPDDPVDPYPVLVAHGLRP